MTGLRVQIFKNFKLTRDNKQTLRTEHFLIQSYL